MSRKCLSYFAYDLSLPDSAIVAESTVAHVSMTRKKGLCSAFNMYPDDGLGSFFLFKRFAISAKRCVKLLRGRMCATVDNDSFKEEILHSWP